MAESNTGPDGAARFWRGGLAAFLFGRSLLQYSGFLQLERVHAKDRYHRIVDFNGGRLEVSTIAREVDEYPAERVLIVGSGPSLLKTIESADTEADAVLYLNGAIRFLDQFTAKRAYLAVSDPIFVRHNIALILESIEAGAIVLLTEACLLVLLRQAESAQRIVSALRLYALIGEGAGSVRGDAEALHARGLIVHPQGDRRQRVGWSTNIEAGVFSGATIAFSALQIAVGLSARVIECHGIELGGATRAFEEKYPQPSKLDRHFKPYIRPSFEFAGAQLRGSGVVVRNVSPDCRIDFSELFDQ